MEKINKNSVIAAINISASRVTACIAVLDKNNECRIAGLGKKDDKLMGSKGILNIDALSSAINESLKSAENEAGLECSKAFVSISGGSLSAEYSRGMVRLGKKGEEVRQRHITGALKLAEATPLGLEKEIIHAIAQSYSIDGQEGIKNPIGLYAVKLEVSALMIAVDTPLIRNIIKALSLSGLELEEVAFTGFAASKCIFSKETKETGVLLIEADSNFTAMSFYFDDVLRGMDFCDKNIVYDGVVEDLRSRSDKLRSGKPISKIIVSSSSYMQEEIVEKVESIFGIPTQVGYAKNVRGSAKDIHAPAYINSIALALYGAEKRSSILPGEGVRFGLLHRVAFKLKSIFNEYF